MTARRRESPYGARAPRRRVDGVEGRGRVDANASRYGRPPSRSRSGFGRGAHAWRRCSWAIKSAISPSTSSRGLSPGWALIIAAMAPRRWSTKPCAALTSATVMNVRGVMAEMWQQSWCQRSSNFCASRGPAAAKIDADGGVAARVRTDTDPLPPVPTYAGNRVASQDAKLTRGMFRARRAGSTSL